MCATCGCADGVGVRIIDPDTGEVTTLDASTPGVHPHEHTDEFGRTYVHSHPARVDPPGNSVQGNS
jgi:hypothetical protein